MVELQGSNMVLECGGKSITPAPFESLESGIRVSENFNATVRNCVVIGFRSGIVVLEGNTATLSGNHLLGNVLYGIFSHDSENVSITGNHISGNPVGIRAENRAHFISDNLISENATGLELIGANRGGLIANNVFKNTINLYLENLDIPGFLNTWASNTYLNDTGTDYSQTCANTNGDGFCDLPLQISPNESDSSPRMANLLFNFPPLAKAGDAYNAVVGQNIAFGSAGSFDPENGALTFRWKFGDGEVGVGPNVSHAYFDNGTYYATLTITDPAGNIGAAVAVVTVSNGSPVITLPTSTNLNLGNALNLAGSFQDPGSESWFANVDYGDGSDLAVLALSGFNFTLTHAYATTGNFQITVQIFDEENLVSSALVNVAVVDGAAQTPEQQIQALHGLISGFVLSGAITLNLGNEWQNLLDQASDAISKGEKKLAQKFLYNLAQGMSKKWRLGKFGISLSGLLDILGKVFSLVNSVVNGLHQALSLLDLIVTVLGELGVIDPAVAARLRSFIQIAQAATSFPPNLAAARDAVANLAGTFTSLNLGAILPAIHVNTIFDVLSSAADSLSAASLIGQIEAIKAQVTSISGSPALPTKIADKLKKRLDRITVLVAAGVLAKASTRVSALISKLQTRIDALVRAGGNATDLDALTAELEELLLQL